MRFRFVLECRESVVLYDGAVKLDPRRRALFVVLVIAPVLDEEVLHSSAGFDFAGGDPGVYIVGPISNLIAYLDKAKAVEVWQSAPAS